MKNKYIIINKTHYYIKDEIVFEPVNNVFDSAEDAEEYMQNEDYYPESSNFHNRSYIICKIKPIKEFRVPKGKIEVISY